MFKNYRVHITYYMNPVVYIQLFYRKHETKKGEDTRFPNAKGKLENEKYRKEQERGDSHITFYITQF